MIAMVIAVSIDGTLCIDDLTLVVSFLFLFLLTVLNDLVGISHLFTAAKICL